MKDNAVSPDSGNNMVELDQEDRKFVCGLREMVIHHMGVFIGKSLSDSPSEEEKKFYEYVQSIISVPSAENCRFVKANIPDYPFSPMYGAVFTFEYDGDIIYYGWDSGRYSIGFYFIPKHLTLDETNYILAEDILNEGFD